MRKKSPANLNEAAGAWNFFCSGGVSQPIRGDTQRVLPLHGSL